MTRIEVDDHPFCLDELLNWLSLSEQDGAVVTFTGKVRSVDGNIQHLFLEQYAKMTQKALANIVSEARQRWPLNRIVVIHRIGKIATNEKIVFVGVSSAHRKSAFAGAEFIMDLLKNKAPFWKKEITKEGEHWVDAKESDLQSLIKWQTTKPE